MRSNREQAAPLDHSTKAQARMDDLAHRGRLIGPDELAVELGVKRSWIYARTRQVDCGGLPVVWCGRYPRFDLEEVLAYLRTQKHPKAA
jgi:predicted DNA-binding transcriptional regulator AlpA